MRHGRFAIYVSTIITVCTISLSSFLMTRHSSRLADSIEHDRIDRAVEACKIGNREQTRNREFVVEDKIQIAVDFFGYDPETVHVELANELRVYEEFASEAFPYNQCSKACVNAALSSKIPDCLPAVNEQGDAA